MLLSLQWKIETNCCNAVPPQWKYCCQLCFRGLFTNSCTFVCVWCVSVTCVASLLPSHYQALFWPSHTSQPLQCTRMVATALFQWTWELMGQSSWHAWDTVGRQHCSALQWSVCTRIPAVWHCESEPQEDVLENNISHWENLRFIKIKWILLLIVPNKILICDWFFTQLFVM